jgi:glycosyltransferase involved in cell wall biosynthesis
MEKPRPINKYKKPVLLVLGNLRPNKNLDLAIKAFQRLDSKTRMNWHLSIRGKSSYSTQEYRTKIEKLIRTDPLGINYKNHYVSEKEFDELINESAYVVLLYTNFQSQSGLAARSIYLSTPLICTSEPAFVETFDEKTAIFCQPNIQSVADTFKKVCREGIPGSLNRARNIRHVYHKFSWEKSIEKHITLYNSIID